MLSWLLCSALAWDERGPGNAPTGRTFAAVDRFAETEPVWSDRLVATPPLDLGMVARATAAELRRQEAEGTPYASAGVFAELGLSLRDVLDTLDLVARVSIEDRGSYRRRLADPEWLRATFRAYRWSADRDAAKARGVRVEDERIRLSQYVVYSVTGSPEWTVIHDTPLYALPHDERNGGEPGDRLRYTRPEVYAGVYLAGGAAEGRAEPLVWLTRADANEALLQGTVEVTLPGGVVKRFNVHENNGRPYDSAVKDPNQQERFWYFRPVDGILGVEDIPLRPGATVAGDVWNLGLGKLVALEWPTPRGPELRLAILADTGGAFEPNLFQLDWLAGGFTSRAAWEKASAEDPTHVHASILVRRVQP
jgi:hypothetical protein